MARTVRMLTIRHRQIDAEAIRHRAALARSKSKSRGNPKSKTETTLKKKQPKSRRRKNSPVGPFRFLNLPAELRDNVYKIVLQAEPAVHLSKRFRGYLITQSALARVNRGIREEFLSTVYIHAEHIKAHVEDFDFQHIVTFLNRLSDNEMKSLVEGPSSRQMKIELSLSQALDCAHGSKDLALLGPWINRLAHPSKKGTKVVASYAVAANHCRRTRKMLLLGMDSECPSTKDRKLEEFAKIRAAISWGMGHR